MTTDHTAEPGGDGTPTELARAVAEIEQHVQEDGWDQAPRLYALAPTADLLEREPALTNRLGLKHTTVTDESLTPIEQEIGSQQLEDLLPTITWPDSVRGCAVALERIVLPPGAEDHVPDHGQAAILWAQNHPQRTDVRVVVGVLRDGTRTSVMRIRGYEDDGDLVREAELSPEIAEALAETLG